MKTFVITRENLKEVLKKRNFGIKKVQSKKKTLSRADKTLLPDLPKNSILIRDLTGFESGIYVSKPVIIQKKNGILTIRIVNQLFREMKINCQKTLNAEISFNSFVKLVRLNKLGNLIFLQDTEGVSLGVKMIESPNFIAIIN